MSSALQRLRSAIATRRDGQYPNTIDSNPSVALDPIDVRRTAFNFASFRWVLGVMMVFAFYYGLVASDRYVTETQVYVKTANESAAISPQAALFGGASSSHQDAVLVQQYIRSRDMLTALDAELDLKGHYSSNGDWVSNLTDNPSNEDFLEYYQNHVVAKMSPDSSVLQIQTQGFSKEFSFELSKAIIKKSEDFINKVNQDIAAQELKFADAEIERSKANVEEIQSRLIKFQRDNQLLSAVASGQALQDVINSLESQLVSTKAEERVLSSYLNDSAPELVAIRDRLNALNAQLAQEKGKFSNEDRRAVNAAGLEYQNLENELALATEQYTQVLQGREKARIELYRKLKHLVVVQSPVLPDSAIYPRRIYNIVSAWIALLLVYGIIVMVIATIREHRDV